MIDSLVTLLFIEPSLRTKVTSVTSWSIDSSLYQYFNLARLVVSLRNAERYLVLDSSFMHGPKKVGRRRNVN